MSQQVTTIQKHHDRFLTREMFESYLLNRGYTSEISGGYRSPCGEHLVALRDFQLSLDRLADFEGKTTEVLFQEIMR